MFLPCHLLIVLLPNLSTPLRLSVAKSSQPLPSLAKSFMATDVREIHQIDAKSILAAEDLTFPHGEKYFSNGESLPSSRSSVHNLNWYHCHECTAEAYLTVDSHSGGVTGTVSSHDGRVFILQPQPNSIGQHQQHQHSKASTTPHHLWVELDMKGFHKSEGKDGRLTVEQPVQRLLLRQQIKSAFNRGKNDSDTIASISVKVYYTTAVRKSVYGPNIANRIENIVSITNQGFRHSNVKISLNLICIEEFVGKEMKNNEEMMAAFQNHTATIPELLDSADVAILLVKKPKISGFAKHTPHEPIAVVNIEGAVRNFTFGHELGHVLGLVHNAEQTSLVLHKGGVGYLIPGTDKRTIMAYPQPMDINGTVIFKYNERINYYSSRDEYTKNMEILGTIIQNSAKVLNERRFIYEQIGDESQPCQGWGTTDT